MKQIIFILASAVMISFTACNDDPVLPENPLNGRTTAVFNPQKSYGQVIDIDGNSYKTIQIGDQIWMAENLRVTKYSNGDALPNVKDNTEWGIQTDGAYCNYNNTENLDTIATYGRLYNWYAAADPRNIAPKGWRVATVQDYVTLFDYIGGTENTAHKLKESGTLHWNEPNDSDNRTGFIALPAGWRLMNEATDQLSFYAIFLTSDASSETHANKWTIACWNENKIYYGVNLKSTGYSIRCIKE